MLCKQLKQCLAMFSSTKELMVRSREALLFKKDFIRRWSMIGNRGLIRMRRADKSYYCEERMKKCLVKVNSQKN